MDQEFVLLSFEVSWIRFAKLKSLPRLQVFYDLVRRPSILFMFICHSSFWFSLGVSLFFLITKSWFVIVSAWGSRIRMTINLCLLDPMMTRHLLKFWFESLARNCNNQYTVNPLFVFSTRIRTVTSHSSIWQSLKHLKTLYLWTSQLNPKSSPIKPRVHFSTSISLVLVQNLVSAFALRARLQWRQMNTLTSLDSTPFGPCTSFRPSSPKWMNMPCIRACTS